MFPIFYYSLFSKFLRGEIEKIANISLQNRFSIMENARIHKTPQVRNAVSQSALTLMLFFFSKIKLHARQMLGSNEVAHTIIIPK